MKRVLVTGGAGFIGSHLVDRLIINNEVVVLDDLSGGSTDYIKQHMSSSNFQFIKGSINSKEDLLDALKGVTTVFHFAAQPDVRLSVTKPMHDFKINMIGGMNLLESLRLLDIDRIVFASSGGTVYGDTVIIPTPEGTALSPISNYGAAKCAFEMYLSSYSDLYGLNAISMRLGNIIGPRLTHGIIFDLYNKLRSDSNRLEVLGSGQQEKGFMYVTDTVEATTLLAERMNHGHLAVNVSSGEQIKVSEIAELMCRELNLTHTQIDYTGSNRGWAGDVIITHPDITRLRKTGWSPKFKLEEGIRQYLHWLSNQYGPIKM